MNKINNTKDAPRGKNIFYLCKTCNIQIPSQPNDNVGCECENIYIDIDYHRLVVKDFNNFQALTIDEI